MYKKLFAVLFAVSLLFAISGTSMADLDQPGYYQKIHGNKNVGKVKYFKNGHPEGPSEWVYLGEGYGEPGPDVNTDDHFFGNASQNNGTFMKKGHFTPIDEDTFTIDNGAFVGGSNSSEAYYGGVITDDGWGLGGAGTIGGTYVGAEHDGKYNLAYGATGNISAAGYGGKDVCGGAGISGEGSLSTAAVSQGNGVVAFASSSGSFSYDGYTTSQGVIIGGGGTAGFSTTNISGGTAYSAAGQISVSGVGTVGM